MLFSNLQRNRLCLVLLAASPFIVAARQTYAQGNLVAWGDNTGGVVSGVPAGTFSAVAAGDMHTAAIRIDGTLLSWGDDTTGALSGTPAGIFTAISAGFSHTTAIRADGSLVTWGSDPTGWIVGSPNGTFGAVSAGATHVVAIRTDGTLASWGDDSFGQVSGTPTGTFRAVAAGGDANGLGAWTVAIRTDGTLVSWGSESVSLAGTFVAVAAGHSHSVAIRTDGILVSWGSDWAGQVSGTPAGTFLAVAAGDAHSAAIRTDGTLVSWGSDSHGQVSATPAGTFVAVSAAGSHTLAIRGEPSPSLTWSGVLQPINADGTSIFRLVQTVPVKFRLTGDCESITTLSARLYAARVSEGIVGTEQEAVSTSAADSGNLFRYSGGQYIFNLGTSGFAAGTWRLRIDLGDGVERTVLISLRR